MPVDSNTRSDSVGQGMSDDGGVFISMNHPLAKALHKEVREKREARERLERRYYVDPRDVRFIVGGR